MKRDNPKYYDCLVCGWNGLSEKPEPPFGSHEICCCCCTQYGLEVRCESDIPNVRQIWLDEGAPWFIEHEKDFETDEVRKPEGWNLEMAKKQIEEYLRRSGDGGA